MEAVLRFVYEIALIVGVIAQRVLLAITVGVVHGIFQLVNNVLGVCLNRLLTLICFPLRRARFLGTDLDAFGEAAASLLSLG